MKNSENKKIKKIIILGVVSLVLSLIIQFILVESKTFSQFSIGNVLAIFAVIAFVGIHFVLGFKKLYDFIIDNRYIISIVLIIVSTIVGFMQNTIEIKEWILTTNVPLCLWWNIKFFAIILASYELMMIISENRYMSAVFATVISMSGAVQWNFEYITPIIIGETIVVLFSNILNSDKKKNKIFSSLGIIVLSFLYFQTNLSIGITFGYIWIALLIWILIKNRNKLKENISYLVLTILLSIPVLVYSMSFINLGFKNDPITKARGASYLYTYMYNILIPFTNMEKKYLYGNFISLFPIPMLVAIYYQYKHEDHIEFLLPVTIVTVLETVFCISGFPEIVSNISGFSNISIIRASIAVNYANLLLMFYMISNIDGIFKLRTAMKLTLISACIIAFISFPTEFSARGWIYLFSAEMCVLFILFFNYGNKKYTRVLLFFLVLFTLVSGVTVNPIVKDKAKIATTQSITVEK